MTENPADKKAVVMIVDDTPANLKLLSDILSPEYTIRPASSGALALQSLEYATPDIILLDIRMPGMDGYEVCSTIKADGNTCDIPIIFISALDDVADKVKGFALGAVDYITKPFQSEEVLARVETHLTIYRLKKQLEQRNSELNKEIGIRKKAEEELRRYQIHLEELVAERTSELKNSEEQYRSLVNNLNTGVFRFIPTSTGEWKWVNPAFLTIFGYSSIDEIIKITVLDTFQSEDDYHHLIQSLQKSRVLKNIEISAKRKDGTHIWIAVTAQVKMNSAGNIDWIDGICDDITVEKEQEHRIKTAVAQINKNMEMLAILNDQIRNPLTVIACYTADLEEELADNIVKQITVIDQIVDKLDKGWIESEKIRNFLMKHYGIG